jgi:hypothetical protein
MHACHHNLMVVGLLNGGLESALKAMDGMDVDLEILMEAKVTDGIFTTECSSGYSVVASNALSAHQGSGIGVV